MIRKEAIGKDAISKNAIGKDAVSKDCQQIAQNILFKSFGLGYQTLFIIEQAYSLLGRMYYLCMLGAHAPWVEP